MPRSKRRWHRSSDRLPARTPPPRLRNGGVRAGIRPKGNQFRSSQGLPLHRNRDERCGDRTGCRHCARRRGSGSTREMSATAAGLAPSTPGSVLRRWESLDAVARSFSPYPVRVLSAERLYGPVESGSCCFPDCLELCREVVDRTTASSVSAPPALSAGRGMRPLPFDCTGLPAGEGSPSSPG